MLVPRNIYSARSVDSRAFFCKFKMVGYPNITNLKKKPRESTDLAEYIFLGTNNFSQLQIVKKLEPFEICQNRPKIKHFFFESTNLVAP